MEIEGFVDATPILAGGVYILIHRGEVVYVGKAKRMLNRLSAHLTVRSAQRKDRVPSWLPIKGIYYDKVLISPCHPDRIDALERSMIDLYRPRYNMQHNRPGPTAAPFSIQINGISVPFNHRPSGLPEITRRI